MIGIIAIYFNSMFFSCILFRGGGALHNFGGAKCIKTNLSVFFKLILLLFKIIASVQHLPDATTKNIVQPQNSAVLSRQDIYKCKTPFELLLLSSVILFV